MGDGYGNERQADVIYLANTNRYLIVWRDNRVNGNNNYGIYGQYIASEGTIEGSNFMVANTAVDESMPRLTFNATTGIGLIVWQKNNGGGAGYDLYGRLLDSNGLLVGDSFAVETADANQQRPVLAANAAGDTLVAWHDNRHGIWDIFMGMKLAAGGWGGVSKVHPAPGAQEKPQIAYNPDDDEYLVVWQDYRSSTNWDIYGQRIDGDGSLLGTNIAIDTTATKHQTRPQVAYGANEYLVVWQHYTDNNNTTYDVYGRTHQPRW